MKNTIKIILITWGALELSAFLLGVTFTALGACAFMFYLAWLAMGLKV